MKLEVGMYVRTEWGISQYKEYETTNDNKILCIPVKDGSNGKFANIEDIVKASHNIIDLIEVGDVIEIKEFKGKYEVRQFGLELSIVKEDTIYNLNSLLCTLNIKSIVTKEQFESMSYKVQ